MHRSKAMVRAINCRLHSLKFYLSLFIVTEVFGLVPPAVLSNALSSHSDANLTASTTLAAGNVRCHRPSLPGHGSVNLDICKPTLYAWMSSAEIDKPKLYVSSGGGLQLTAPPCIISLKPLLIYRSIVLSLRQIVEDVILILKSCEQIGIGGWTEIEGTTWTIDVNGVGGRTA